METTLLKLNKNYFSWIRLFNASSYILFSFSFLIIRLPLYLVFPSADKKPDTFSYLKVMEAISSGQVPDLGTRTPGYPIFIKAALLIWENFFSVVLLQGIFYYLACMFAIWAVSHWNVFFSFCVAIILSLFQTQNIFLLQEFMLYTDSLSTSVLIFYCGLLCLALKTRGTSAYTGVGFSVAILVLIRQGNFYLLAPVLMVAIFQMLQKESWKKILGQAGPLAAVFLFYFIYNYFYFGVWTLSYIGPYNRLFATHSFIYEHPENPDHINAMIKKSRSKMKKEELDYLKDPKDLVQARFIYHRFTDVCIYPCFKGNYENREYFHQITSRAIKDYPGEYWKFFKTMFYAYYFSNPGFEVGFDRVTNYYRHFESVKKADRDSRLVVKFKPRSLYGEDDQTKTTLNRMLCILDGVQFKVGNYVYAPYLSLLVLLWSLFLCLKSRFKDITSTLVMVIYSGQFFSAILVSLTIVPFIRYSYPYDFLHLAAPLVLVVLVFKTMNKSFNISSHAYKVGVVFIGLCMFTYVSMSLSFDLIKIQYFSD